MISLTRIIHSILNSEDQNDIWFRMNDSISNVSKLNYYLNKAYNKIIVSKQ